jgi:hypothetical protein
MRQNKQDLLEKLISFAKDYSRDPTTNITENLFGIEFNLKTIKIGQFFGTGSHSNGV